MFSRESPEKPNACRSLQANPTLSSLSAGRTVDQPIFMLNMAEETPRCSHCYRPALFIPKKRGPHDADWPCIVYKEGYALRQGNAP